MAMLLTTPAAIFSFLAEHSLVSRELITDGGVTVERLDGRNHNYLVSIPENPPLFVKSPATTDVFNIDTIHREALCLWLGLHTGNFGQLSKFTPSPLHFSSLTATLVVQGVQSAPQATLSVLADAEKCRAFARAIATLLAGLEDPRTVENRSWPYQFREVRPWILTLHDPSICPYRPMNQADRYVLGVLRSAPSIQALSQLLKGWSYNGLIHGDLKISNVLFTDDLTPEDPLVVDWELAGIGDVAWDLASIVHSIIHVEVASKHGTQQGGAIPEVPNLPWTSVFIRVLLDQFKARSRHALKRQWEDRFVAYVGAKLIQACLEETRYYSQLLPHTLAVANFALLLLSSPHALGSRIGHG